MTNGTNILSIDKSRHRDFDPILLGFEVHAIFFYTCHADTSGARTATSTACPSFYTISTDAVSLTFATNGSEPGRSRSDMLSEVRMTWASKSHALSNTVALLLLLALVHVAVRDGVDPSDFSGLRIMPSCRVCNRMFPNSCIPWNSPACREAFCIF